MPFPNRSQYEIADKQLEHLVKMIIYRHRFSGFVAMPASTAEERARHLDLCRKAMQCALTIIADHVHIVCFSSSSWSGTDETESKRNDDIL
jgi:hypothetical protein